MHPGLGFSRGISILQRRRELSRTQAGVLHALPELRETLSLHVRGHRIAAWMAEIL